MLVLPLGLQIYFFLINFGIRHNFSSFNLKRGQKYGLSVNIYIRIQTLTTSVTYDYYWLRLTNESFFYIADRYEGLVPNQPN